MTGERIALEGVRICDLTGQLAGAGATRYLAAMGAQVIRVEDPVRQGRWDILRGGAPFVDERRGNELGGAFNNHNVEKLGVTINLRVEAGRALLKRLVGLSDVVCENFSADVMTRLGLGYEELKAVKPDIIYVSNSGFGHTGPYRTYRSWGSIVQAVSGLTFGVGLPGHPPAGFGYSYMDHHGGNFQALAVLAALARKQRTGLGTYIDMSCTEAAAGLVGTAMLDAAVNDRPARRPGSPAGNHSASPVMVPHSIYGAAGDDEWVAIACRDDDDWAALVSVLDEEWAQSSELTALAGRVRHQSEIDRRLEAWTRQRDRFEVAEMLRRTGVPAAAVSKPVDRIDDHRSTDSWGLFPTVVHDEIGAVRVDGLPVHFSRTDWKIERGAPCLGTDNVDVFCGIVGLTDDELADLASGGVI